MPEHGSAGLEARPWSLGPGRDLAGSRLIGREPASSRLRHLQGAWALVPAILRLNYNTTGRAGRNEEVAGQILGSGACGVPNFGAQPGLGFEPPDLSWASPRWRLPEYVDRQMHEHHLLSVIEQPIPCASDAQRCTCRQTPWSRKPSSVHRAPRRPACLCRPADERSAA